MAATVMVKFITWVLIQYKDDILPAEDMPLWRYDEVRPSYLHNGTFYVGQITSFYWNKALNRNEAGTWVVHITFLSMPDRQLSGIVKTQQVPMIDVCA